VVIYLIDKDPFCNNLIIRYEKGNKFMSTKKEGSLLLCLRKSTDSDELEVLLGLKYPKAHIGANTLNGAGGGIEDGETPEMSAVRENSEEFGKQFTL